MKKTDDFADDGALKDVLLSVTQEKMSHGSHKETILITIQAVMDFVQEIIEQLEDSGQTPAVSCGSECSFCCHSLIRVIPAEALLINAFIKQNFSDASIHDLEKKIHAYHLLVDGKNLKQRVFVKDQTPCIFLKNDNCRIYPVRPFICRAWNSLDKPACKAAFLSGDSNAEINNSPARNYLFGTARDIFMDMDKTLDLEKGLYKIPNAIQDCLNHSDSLERWCNHQPVFTQGQRT